MTQKTLQELPMRQIYAEHINRRNLDTNLLTPRKHQYIPECSCKFTLELVRDRTLHGTFLRLRQ